MANRAPPTGYNPPQRPLAWWHYLLSVMAVVLVIAATLLTARLFQQLGMPPDWSYGLPAFGFAA